jgi:nicotinate-nucleotide--dimethylbenzimidazole phosphoribosyltransferase
MYTFNIQAPDEALRPLIQDKIDNLNKPKGSLGRLETLAMQICLAQQTLTPSLTHPCHFLLGGDHGIEREGVSVSPREVTWQQMINFTKGGGGVNMFCRQHGFRLRIVDVGVDHDLSQVPGILHHKIAPGTRNFLYEPAMTEDEYNRTFTVGIDLVDVAHSEGSNLLCLGEMGIANTSPSSIWMSLFCNIPLDECIGAGAGLNAPGISHKRQILHQALDHFLSTLPPQQSTVNCQQSTDYVIRYFGGFEMVAAVAAMLRAAEHGMLILVDGFIMTACALAACRLYPEAQAYMVFGHCGDESGHRRMLDALGAEPILNLGMRLGEGTGALCAFPIVDSAVRMMNEMNNFDKAQITKYF